MCCSWEKKTLHQEQVVNRILDLEALPENVPESMFR